MAMSGNSGGGAVADINITPLIDIMLVLLVIFILTAPVPHHQIKIDLPQPNPNVKQPTNPPPPRTLSVSLNPGGQVVMTWSTPLGTSQLGGPIPVPPPPSQANPNPQPPADYYPSIRAVIDIALAAQLQPIGAKPLEEQPEVDIEAADKVPYRIIAKVLAEARKANVQKIGFKAPEQGQ